MGNKEKNFVSAVVYVHNAEKRIENFLKMLISEMESNFENSEIICVNDASNDHSLLKIKEVSQSASTTSVSVVNMSYFHGLELAMNAGVDLSIGDFVFEFDNTIVDYDSKLIMDVYKRSLEGFDIVSAALKCPQKLTSSIFYRVFETFSEQSVKMSTESFRVLSRRVINRISSMNKTIPYRKVLYANCGLRTDKIMYSADVRNHKLDQREKKFKSRLAVDSLILFTDMGYSFSKMMTIIMMLISLFMIVYSVIIYSTANPVAGWTTTILFMSIAFFGLFGVLTVIIKYLQILVDLVFKRRQYSFENIEKLTK